MCGRFARAFEKQQLIELLHAVLNDLDPASFPGAIRPSYNVAPSQLLLAVGKSKPDHPHKFALLHWGFVPSYAKEISPPSPINARAEGIETKPMFRSAFNKCRCLILTNGFYEWKREGKSKTPYYLCVSDDTVHAFAGIYSVARIGEANHASCAILTISANALVAQVHDRMPVILEARDFVRWCDPEIPGAQVLDLLRPFPAERMQAHPVAVRVNSPANDDSDLMLPLSPGL